MKKLYIKPEIIVMVSDLPYMQLLAGSLGANDQIDPSMAPMLFGEEMEQ